MAKSLEKKRLLSSQYSSKSIAALALYITSYLMGCPKTPEEIHFLAKVKSHRIHKMYKLIYPLLKNMVKKEWLDHRGKSEKLPNTEGKGPLTVASVVLNSHLC
jgi:transcription initiation factor TFIIIB Brf1 subunit/transcription initiation factor TFIIB